MCYGLSNNRNGEVNKKQNEKKTKRKRDKIKKKRKENGNNPILCAYKNA
jgi:hypothetical protein